MHIITHTPLYFKFHGLGFGSCDQGAYIPNNHMYTLKLGTTRSVLRSVSLPEPGMLLKHAGVALDAITLSYPEMVETSEMGFGMSRISCEENHSPI